MKIPPKHRCLVALLLIEALLVPSPARANPRGGRVRGGSATIAGQGTSVVDVHQRSQKAVLSWEGFNIGGGETTNFHQPNARAVAVNRILDGQASRILGSLNANGHVYLINPNGILFGAGSSVNVHALTAATSVKAGDLMALGAGFDPSATSAAGASIRNEGTIRTGEGGFVYLVAPKVENAATGVIVSPDGEVRLAAGSTVYLTDRADGLGLAIEYTAPGAPGSEAVNLGKLVADGGLINLRADLVRQSGSMEANGIREKNGKIELYAETSVELTGGSVTDASGGAAGESAGGVVDVYSKGEAVVERGARIDVSGGTEGGAGGFAEVSAERHVALAGTVDAGAAAGYAGGRFVVDAPETAEVNDGTAIAADDVAIAADETLTVTGTVTLDGKGGGGDDPRIALRSGRDVVFQDGAKVVDGGTGNAGAQRWNVDLVAGAVDPDDAGSYAVAGDGGVYLGGVTRGADGVAIAGSGAGEVSLTGADGAGGATRGNLRVVAAGDVVVGDGGGLRNQRGRIDVEAGRDVQFTAGSRSTDGVIETGSGDIRVVAGRSVQLSSPTGGQGNAAIRTRGVSGADPANSTKQDGGSIFVHAVSGDVDAGIGNRWLRPGPRVADPKFDLMPVVPDGILGIGTEAGGDVTVVAGGDVRTNSAIVGRTGGSAYRRSGEGDYTGGHVGVFGRPVTDRPPADTSGPEVLPNQPESRLLVVAGGDITGDYVMRHGRGVLRAGYTTKAGIAPETLDADDVAGLAPSGSPGSNLERSPLAMADATRGWFGTLRNPVTIELLEGAPIIDATDPTKVVQPSIDILGANGVALRTIETPSLVYPTRLPPAGTRQVPGYSANDTAWVEAETGDVVLLGSEITLPVEGRPSPEPNFNARLLPPSLRVKTNTFTRGTETRGGDFVLLNDFLLFPSARGGLTLDVAGKTRTANFAGLAPADLQLDAYTTGNAALQEIVIPAGSFLVDDATGLRYQLGSGLQVLRRVDAQAATGNVLVRASTSDGNRAIAIPEGTRISDDRGRLFVVQPNDGILAPELRQSTGFATFKASGALGADISLGTLLVAPDGTVFETTALGTLRPGQREISVPIRAVRATGNTGRDAAAYALRLSEPIAGIASATNLRATSRPPEALVRVVADTTGATTNAPARRVVGLVDPIPGVQVVFNPQLIGGGADDEPFGLPNPGQSLTARALLDGPVGAAAVGRRLRLEDPSVLPSGVSASEIVIDARGADTRSTLRAVAYKDLQSDPATGNPRVDPTDSQIAFPEGDNVWIRDSTGAVTTATVRQSEADPGFDARGPLAFDRYNRYYQVCRSGAVCDSVADPRGVPINRGTGPTHLGDTSPANLVAKGGFERVRFELAEAATLRTDGDLYDVALVTQHSSQLDRTLMAAPTGNARFGAGSRTLIDQQRGPNPDDAIAVPVPDDANTGLQVSGPGSAAVLVGVVSHAEADANADGVITQDEFPGSSDVFASLDRATTLPDGRLTPTEAPYIPTGRGGEIRMQQESAQTRRLGFQTVGNIPDLPLPAGGAALQVAAAGNVLLQERGSIGTLQGGDLYVSSVGGAILGGTPSAATTEKRGIFTLYTGPGFEERAADPTGGGRIDIDTFGDFNVGGLALATLSGSPIRIESRGRSVRAGVGTQFSRPLVRYDSSLGEIAVSYEGSGISSTGTIELVAREDIDIGAGITGAGITISAGGNVLAGTGALASTGGISIGAGGTISGNIQAAGSISISGGTVTSGSNVASTGGLVTGAGSVASNSGSGRTSAETSLADDEVKSAGIEGTTGGGLGRSAPRVVRIDVSSRPCGPGEPDCGA